MPSIPGVTSSLSNEWIELPAPNTVGELSVEEALFRRRSVRQFAAYPLDLSEAAQLLWACQGTTSPSGLRTAPSAGALYPLEVCLAARDVLGIEAGIYRYEPSRHVLQPVARGARHRELSIAAKRQEAVLNAPAVVAISAIYRRTEVKYRERARRYVHMEVGHAAQCLCLQATALGLATVVVGAFGDRDLESVLCLGSETEPLCLIPIGRP